MRLLLKGVTPQSWMAAGLLLCSFLFLTFQGGKVALMIFIILVLLSLYLALGRWSGIARATGTRTLTNAAHETTVEAGTIVEVRIQVQIPGYWPIPYVVTRDHLQRRGGGEYVFESSFVPDWRRRGGVTYTIPPLRRGFYRFDRTECTTVDIFGLFEHKGSFTIPQTFCVLPRTVPIQEWKQFHLMIKGQHHQSVTTQALKETTQINGVREYIYGDRLSRIHWNATAKTGTWKSKEFERESLPKTYVVLDRMAAAYLDQESFELAVSVTASLFEYGRKQDLAMGLLSVGEDMHNLEPRRGRTHYQQITNHMIDVQADGTHSLLNILKEASRHMMQGCFVVIVSPQADERMMQTLNWVSQRQMIPCHILIASSQTADRREAWNSMLKARGWLSYATAELEELSVVLGGKRK